MGGNIEKALQIKWKFLFLLAPGIGRTTLGVGGLCIFFVTALRIGALPNDVGADVAT